MIGPRSYAHNSALCRSFVSSSIISGGVIGFLCFIVYDETCDRFKLNMSLNLG